MVGRCALHGRSLCPQLEVAGQVGFLHLLLTPQQLQQLQELLSAMSLAGEAAGQSWGWMVGEVPARLD